tara:strand:- start:18610 stop:20532 length:1923 start_codon:yes stop_codon:yes gene_type:complete
MPRKLTYPSSLVSFVDVPEVSRVRAKFYYNFFEADETTSDKYDPNARKILRRSGQNLVSSRRMSPAAKKELERKVPRYIALTWRPLKVNVPGVEESKRIRFLRIQDHIDEIQDEASISNNSFTGLVVQDSGLDDKLTPFLNMTLNLTQEKNPASPTDKAKELNQRTGPEVTPKFLADAMNAQATGARFVDEEKREELSRKKSPNARDVTLAIQLNNKFADVLIDSATSDPSSIFADEMADLDELSEAITEEALTGVKPNEIDPEEYDLIAEPIRVRMIDAGQADTKSRVIGYIIEKYEVDDETYELVKIKDIIINNPTSTRLIDTRVKYGKTYVYQIKTVAQVDFQAPSEDQTDIMSSTMLIMSKPSNRAIVECIETMPPSEPADFKPVWHFTSNTLNLMWNFPVNPQRDIKKFQVFRRKSILEPFELVAMLDFDDSTQRHPDLEDIDESRRIYLKHPALNYRDNDFTMDSKFIYAVCSIDARNFTSNYSNQFEVTFDRANNRLVTKEISPSGAPKQYPNLYLKQDLFVDTIRDSGHRRVHIYFDPEYLKITDKAGSDLELIKTTKRSPRDKSGSYQLQFINVDQQKERKISIEIDDTRPRGKEETEDLALVRARRATRRARRRKRRRKAQRRKFNRRSS